MKAKMRECRLDRIDECERHVRRFAQELAARPITALGDLPIDELPHVIGKGNIHRAHTMQSTDLANIWQDRADLKKSSSGPEKFDPRDGRWA